MPLCATLVAGVAPSVCIRLAHTQNISPGQSKALDWVRVGTSQHSCVQAACGVQQARPGSTEQFPRVVWFGQLPSTSIIVCVYTESWSSVLCGKEGLGRGSMAMLDEIVHRTGPTAAQRAEKDQERHGSRARERERDASRVYRRPARGSPTSFRLRRGMRKVRQSGLSGRKRDRQLGHQCRDCSV